MRNECIRPLCFLLGVTLGLGGTPVEAADKAAIIAVFDVEDTRVRQERLSLDALKAMRDYLANQLAQDGVYKVVPTSEIQAALRDGKADSYKACYDEGCQIEIGKEIAAQKSLSTKISQFDRECVVSATLYDLRETATDKAASAKSACSQSALLEAFDLVAKKLRGGRAPVLEAKPWNWTPTIIALAGLATSLVGIVIGTNAKARFESGALSSEIKSSAVTADVLLWTGAVVATGGVTWQVFDF